MRSNHHWTVGSVSDSTIRLSSDGRIRPDPIAPGIGFFDLVSLKKIRGNPRKILPLSTFDTVLLFTVCLNEIVENPREILPFSNWDKFSILIVYLKKILGNARKFL